MRSILILSLLVVSLFPACKRNNKHTQSSAVSTKCQVVQAEAFPDGTCDLVDRTKLHKGVACLVAAPATLGAGASLSYSVLVGPGCCVPGGAAFLIAFGIGYVSIGATVFLLYKGCSYLAQHARANKERERRCKICKKVDVQQVKQA